MTEQPKAEKVEKRLRKDLKKANKAVKHLEFNSGAHKGYVNNKDVTYKQSIDRKKLNNLINENKMIKRQLRDAAGRVSSSACDSDAGVFYNTGENKYLHSLLVPRDGAASVPDDVMRMHTIRSETITANIAMPSSTTSGTVSGVLVLYPNHPTSLIGHVFLPSTDPSQDGSLVYYQTLQVAQDLAESYDYGRRVSAELTVRSSTLPSGMYAINGTFNGVRVEGTPSELGLPENADDLYSMLLSTTTNLYDKIGNVSVGDGVTVLGLPDSFVSPYIRLGDTSPYAMSDGAVIYGSPHIYDESDNLSTEIFYINSPAVTIPGAYTVLGGASVNFDATIGVEFEIETVIPYSIMTNVPANQRVAIQHKIQFVDLFGNTVWAAVYDTVCSTVGGTGSNDQIYTCRGRFLIEDLVLSSPEQSLDFSTDSLAAVAAVSISTYVNPATTPIPFASTTCATTRAKFTSVSGARPGVLTPTVVVAFQSVAAGSVLTVSGVANYELIPNPDLRKNLETKYAHYSPQELEYAKMVIANRTKYNIRGIYTAPDYSSQIDSYRDISCLRMPKVASAALTWKDVLGFGKKLVNPLLNAGQILVPEATPMIDTIRDVVSSKAASGNLIASRASGNPIVFTNRASYDDPESDPLEVDSLLLRVRSVLTEDEIEYMDSNDFWGSLIKLQDPVVLVDSDLDIRRKFDTFINEYVVDSDEFNCSDNLCGLCHENVRLEHGMFWDAVESLYSRPIEFVNEAVIKRKVPKRRIPIRARAVQSSGMKITGKSVIFPTVTTVTTDVQKIVGEGVFLAVLGDFTKYFHYCYNPGLPFTKTLGKGRVYGWENPIDYVFPLILNEDVTFLPINPNLWEPTLDIRPSVKWPFVSDHSCEGALWLIANCSFSGLFPVALTGAINLNHGVPFLMPNPVARLKREDLNSHGRLLAGNSTEADLEVSNLSAFAKSVDIESLTKQAKQYHLQVVKQTLLDN